LLSIWVVPFGQLFCLRYRFPEIGDEVPENFKATAGYADNTDGLWKIAAHETHGRRDEEEPTPGISGLWPVS
jgi:hypothetical protein